MAAPRPPAILLGGGPTALSVARSLSRAGIPVYALDAAAAPLRLSRHRRAFVDVGSGDGREERFLDWLTNGPGEGVILPCADEGLDLVARNRETLAQLGYLSIEANDEVVLAMLDKPRTYELASAAGFDVPWMVGVQTIEDAISAAAHAGYPCALKPRHSHLFAHRFRGKAFVVGGEAELREALSATLALGLEMTVTEIIPGPDTGFCSYFSYLDEEGRPLLELTNRKRRQFPPGFGLGCYHVTDWNPEAAELGLRFFQGVGIRGLANVEFKRDARDGRLKLIECNHRFTLVTEQLRASGIDLAWFTYARILGLPTGQKRSYRQGVGFWNPLRDARAFLAYRRQGELTFSAWIRSLCRPLRFPFASLDDPVPSVAAGLRRLRQLLRSIAPGRRPAGMPTPQVSGRAPRGGPVWQAPTQPSDAVVTPLDAPPSRSRRARTTEREG